ncbi:MAG: hypothetical protein R6U98_10030, partial [Pirellulaceae bacterium]
MESRPTQAVLPLVGLAAEKVIRDRYNYPPTQWLFRPAMVLNPPNHRHRAGGEGSNGRCPTRKRGTKRRIVDMPSRCFQCMVLASVCIGLVGCSTEGDGIGDERERMPTPVQEQRPPREFSDPSIEYVSVQPDSGDTDAVAVAGHPLLHTRQLLPLDADGNMVG